MKKFRKLLAIVLTAVMLVTAAPLSGLAGLSLPGWLDFGTDASALTGTPCGTNVKYTYSSSSGNLTISGRGAIADFSKPSDSPFAYMSITSLTIGDGVTRIGDYAFTFNTSGGRNITNCSIPSSLTSIGTEAFDRTSVTNVRITDLKSWCEIDFADAKANPICNSTSNLYLNGVKVTDMTIPDTTTSINDYAFCSLSSLTSVTAQAGVTYIGDYAFKNCTGLTSAELPGAEYIGEGAFEGCTHLTGFNVPESLSSIGDNVFKRCTSLTGFTVDSNNQRFQADDDGALYCESVLVRYPAGKTDTNYKIYPYAYSIGAGAFDSCSSLESIEFSRNLYNVSDNAFSGADNLTDIYYHSGDEDWGNVYCSYTGNDSFMTAEKHFNYHTLSARSSGSDNHTIECTYCDYYTVEPHNYVNGVCEVCDSSIVYYVHFDANGGSGLTMQDMRFNYAVPQNLTRNVFTKSGYIFRGWSEDQNASYPEYYDTQEVSKLTDENLKTITLYAVWEDLDTSLLAPYGRCGADLYWSFNDVTGVLTISGTGDFFRYSSSGNELSPFRGREMITSVVIENGVTNICECLFEDCVNLTSIEIPSSVKIIKTGSFHNCTSLTGLVIPQGVETIENSVFWNCPNLTSINIPASVTMIYFTAFSDCANLASITVSPDNTAYDSRNNCNAIIRKDGNMLLIGCKNSTIPEGVKCIETGAFRNCSDITSITIPSSVKLIYNSAFFGCSGLTDVYYPGTQTEWEAINIYTEGNTPLINAIKYFNYNPNALPDALANVPEVITCFSDESVEELQAVLEEIYAGTEGMTEQEIQDLAARLNAAIANLEVRTHEVNVPDNCTSTQTDVEGVNYKLATITAPATNANGDKFVYWTDSYGNIVSTYRTYRFYVGNDAGYTPVYASAADYDQMKADALITSRVIDVKNNRNGNLVFLAEHSVSGSAELIGHGMIITTDAASANEDDLIRGSYNDEIIDFQAQTTKNSKTGMIQVCANVEGDTVWARTYVVDAEGVAHYGQIQSYDVSNLVSTHGEAVILDGVELISQNEEAPAEEEPAEEPAGIITMILNIITIIIQKLDVVLKNIISLIK